jgi:DNA helicase MCM8
MSCVTPQCKGKRFEPELDKAQSVDWQTIRVQENVQGLTETGRMPRMIEVELLNQLADSCVPGDTVTIVGIIKREAVDKAIVQKKKNKAVFYLYMEARTVLNTKQPVGSMGASVNDEYDAAELMALRKIAESVNVFQVRLLWTVRRRPCLKVSSRCCCCCLRVL